MVAVQIRHGTLLSEHSLSKRMEDIGIFHGGDINSYFVTEFNLFTNKGRYHGFLYECQLSTCGYFLNQMCYWREFTGCFKLDI